jgi:hypothetical protein
VRSPLSETELIAMLDRWSGGPVAVRVVGRDHQLLAVFRGRLGRRSGSRRPSLFWPLEDPIGIAGAEQSGLYVHRQVLEAAFVHPGDVIEWRQVGVTLNVRRP